MAQKKRWNEISVVSRWRIVVLGIVQLALQFVALRDLVKRPAANVRGSKGAWAAASFINFLGPIAYLACGRLRNKK
ncbi:PLDc N-terminal domain-containing protein [Paeniglutamicibacter psychrophenolicus]|uniref:PLDc N-terminal domain-containing protein n=1 Tax=Paeniglutamicibacter psychrophenolicus TaxID=257454 RepID=UPI002782988E|nr:PLDc N-terminal domain-containing protein [Paeniglutamicibacter psychrophenolicus]MDQ0094221.1 bacteriorhodopsin [Paeniglutamicibacter psychrophenolicus]